MWFWEDFEVGEVFETRARTITEADIVSFSGWSWDTNPVHTDAEDARSGRYGERIAHGLLGMSVAMGLVAGTGRFEGTSVALLGVDQWRFRLPIRIGETVFCRVRITGKRKSRSGPTGVLDRWFEVVNQDGAVAQEGSIALLIQCQQASQRADDPSRSLG